MKPTQPTRAGRKRETTLHHHDIARAIDLERQHEIERRLRHRAGRPPRPPGRSVLQALGRALIRVGSMLAAEGPLEVGLVRPSGQPESQL